MLILDESDMLTPVRATRDLVDSLQFSEVVVIPGAGHTIMSEKPEVLLDSLLRIVQQGGQKCLKEYLIFFQEFF